MFCSSQFNNNSQLIQKILPQKEEIPISLFNNDQQQKQQFIQNIDKNDGNFESNNLIENSNQKHVEPIIIDITKNISKNTSSNELLNKSLEIFNEKQNIDKEINNKNENTKQFFEDGIEQQKYIENNNQLKTNNLFQQQKEEKTKNIQQQTIQYPSSSFQTPQQQNKSILYTNNRSSIRSVPPNKDEVKALAARFIASKRPDFILSKTCGTPPPKVVLVPSIDNDSNNLIEEGRKISSELKQIKQKIGEIEEQDELVKTKILDYERGSEQENEIIEHHQRLVGEKEQLSRRQDYLNFQLELNETDFKILHLRKRLATSNEENNEIDGENILINGRRDSNQMLMELKEFMDLKDELTHKLSDLEAEDEEGVERSRLILEQTKNQNLNFRRGTQDPLNVSKRLMGWLNGMEQRFRQ
uniref:BMERB domain-containing protein n=1 Tax=Meloidogyne hapla TaxID=6305 RepID=A0A1I8B7S0_MELHA